jgi:two-component sensor histidine kinase
MALVHEMLYGTRDLTRLDVGEYVRTLARQVLHSQGSAAQVALQLDLEPTEMPIDVVIPCGLILNEVIANAVKHGFPEGRPGTIRVGLHGDASAWELLVRDDGVGLPAGFDATRATSLGLQLVRTLTEQLGGRLDVRSEGGTLVRVSLPQPRGSATPSVH